MLKIASQYELPIAEADQSGLEESKIIEPPVAAAEVEMAVDEESSPLEIVD